MLNISVKVYYMTYFAIGLFTAAELAKIERKKKAAEAEFKEWASGSPYTVFRGQSVYVNVEVEELEDSLGDAITIFLDSPSDTSMSWGGKELIGWAPDAGKIMFLEDSQYSDTNGYSGYARHEFGHSLGLGDAYKRHSVPWLYWGPEVNFSLPGIQQYTATGKVDMVMHNNGSVKGKDIEMVIWAFATGERQDFSIQALGHEISDLLYHS